MELERRLAELRREKNLSQEELAEKLYVSRQTISNWERDKTYPDINSLLLMANYFDVSLDHLIKGDVNIMKHQVDQSQFKKWLILGGISWFIFSASHADVTLRSLINSLILKSINSTLLRLFRKVMQTLSNSLILIKFDLLNNLN